MHQGEAAAAARPPNEVRILATVDWQDRRRTWVEEQQQGEEEKEKKGLDRSVREMTYVERGSWFFVF